MERFLKENNAAKLFCGFEIDEKTPDHSLFGYIRNKIGTVRLARIFREIRDLLKKQGYISEALTFVDASHLISKANIWSDRDKIIKEKEDTFRNAILEEEARNKKIKLSADLQARNGCKGKNKYWFGYKRHISVDMESGLINKVAITPANVHDGKAVDHILPDKGDIYADKGYCIKSSLNAIKAKGLGDCVIKKNNMKCKNFEKDREISRRRCPFERVFSKMNHRARYRVIAKNQFSMFMEAIVFNLKRMMNLNNPNFA